MFSDQVVTNKKQGEAHLRKQKGEGASKNNTTQNKANRTATTSNKPEQEKSSVQEKQTKKQNKTEKHIPIQSMGV